MCEDLKEIRREWRAAAVRDFEMGRQIEVRKLDRLEREAWAAWECSRQASHVVVVSEMGERQRTKKTVREEVGNSRFLEIVHKCIASRRTLLGLDAPMRIAPTTPDGKEPYRMAVEHLSVDELRLLKKLRDRSRAIAAGEEHGN